MEYMRQTIGSAELNGIFDLPPMLRNRRVEVIVLPAPTEGEPTATVMPNRSLKFGLAKGAEVPDSFFEPLPEEDLQAWGL